MNGRGVRNFFHLLLIMSVLCFGSGCVSIPEGAAETSPRAQRSVEPPYGGLEPGYKTEETAHFLVKAYSAQSASSRAADCESNYGRIMSDLGLFSFVPARPYNIVVYGSAEEFWKKTGQPRWSGGVAYGNAILIYDSPGASAVLAHEMTHLIFNEFMESADTGGLIWLNEGMAVYEEMRASSASRTFYSGLVITAVAPAPIAFVEMINFRPGEAQTQTVERWYAQVGSLVAFMIKEGGSLSFSSFLTRLKEGATLDNSISGAYSRYWQDLTALQKAWLLTMGKK